MGYRLDIENKKIIETGVISIDIKPKEAEVYLNDIKITKKIPIRLTNRTPGTYNLKISLPGYKTWEKNIDVKSKQTTYIKNINLLKDSLPTAIDNTKNNIDSFLPSTDGRFILLSSTKNKTTNIELFDSQSEEFSPLFKLPENTKYQLEWSPFNNYILFTKFEKNIASISILNADNTDTITNYEVLIDKEKVLHYQWQKNSPIPTIFIDENNKIFRLTTNTSEQMFNLSSTTIWYIDDLEKFWILEKDNLIVKNSNDSQDKISIPNPLGIKKIIDINNYRAILQTDTEVLIISREQNKQEAIHTLNFHRNTSTNEWLTWSAWELWSIYEHDKPALLNRTSDNIKFVFPLDDVGALAIVNNHGIESFNPGYYVNQNLYNGEVYNASVYKRENRIYFFGKVGDKTGLYELNY